MGSLNMSNQQVNFDDPSKLIECLREEKEKNGNLLIGIDGFDGTGKTNLAHRRCQAPCEGTGTGSSIGIKGKRGRNGAKESWERII